MKSSIFDKDPIDRRRGLLKTSSSLLTRGLTKSSKPGVGNTPGTASASLSASKQPSSFQRRAQSSSPFPHSSHSSIFSPKPASSSSTAAAVVSSPITSASLNSIPKFKKRPTGTADRLGTTPSGHITPLNTPSLAPSIAVTNLQTVSWNLDDMVRSYQEYGLLPQPLSPSLPASFKNRNIPTPSSNGALSDDNDDIPLSMLSPTLPSIFDIGNTAASTTNNSNSNSTVVLPVPKRVRPTSSSNPNSLTSNFTGKVRSIRKNIDLENEKYIVQITFSTSLKRKLNDMNKVVKTTTRPIAGLGITTDRKDSDSVEESRRDRDRERESKVREREEERERRERERLREREKEREREREKEKEREREREREREKEKEKARSRDRDSERDRERERRKHIDKEKDKEKENTTKNTLESQSSKLTNKDEAGLQDYKAKLLHRKNYWLQMAKETKLKSKDLQGSDKLFNSVIVRFDSILLYMIAYDYEEKLKLASDVLPLERYWNVLMQDCKELIELISSIVPKTTLLSPALAQVEKSVFHALIGILYLARAIIIKRINAILQRVIRLYIDKKKTDEESKKHELNNKVIELQQQYINNFDLIKKEFESSERYHLSIILKSCFPKSWSNRLKDIASSSIDSSINSPEAAGFVPGNDKYYLPIGIYSELQEIGGLIFNSVKEGMEILGNINPQKKVIYYLKCGLKEGSE